MMQHFFSGVTLNMLFGHIYTLKLIILDILSKLDLLTRGLNSLTYPVYLMIYIYVIFSISTYFENKKSTIVCYKYNKSIPSTVFNYNKLATELDIENSIPDS